jgi:hypothetical protein
MKNIFLILLWGLLFLFGCSGSKEISNDFSLRVNIVKIDSWINAMPNSGGGFYISGIMRVKNTNDYTIDSLNMRMNVYQHDTLLYSLRADFDQSAEPKTPIKPGEEREFTFSSGRGGLRKTSLNENNSVNLEMILSSGGKLFFHKIDSLKIEKVY